MKEMLEVIRAYGEAGLQGRQTALATVVHVDGSSYRRPGARMLVDDVGNLTGAISGGCLEGDALTKAMLVLSQQKAKLATYDTTDDDDAKFGVGLGCNGIIQVLIEPINSSLANNPVELLKSIAGKRQQAVLVTLFSLHDKRGAQPGTCLLYTQHGKTVAGQIPMGLQELLLQDAQTAMASQTSAFKSYVTQGGNITAFIEYVHPPLHLVVVGAGNDAVPLVKMADILGWQTTIIDGRNTHAKAGRFVPGCQVLVSKPEQALQQVALDDRAAVVLMTHNYNYDLAMLRALAGGNLAYIGSLGPKKKLERMLGELREEGIFTSNTSCLYGPAGLDIGAETPEEIALSILAEIKAVFAARGGGFLRDKKEVIHPREATLIQQAATIPKL